ncbi:hypothetical protein F3087_26960 [Nocardia colli]|uniref:Uncharacterized protein n=1 Tax=Nocardia colli TaxID=2545717 RepID=A0A5N0ECJ7_9NOCA|nr:hypothetical protein [Nocardia colli]KAA8886229.1 hypothetical protein F3087_26960 [Nocardia colli]
MVESDPSPSVVLARTVTGLAAGAAIPFALAERAAPEFVLPVLLVGGAVGGVAQAAIQGDLRTGGDVLRAAGTGAAWSLGGGVIGRGVAAVDTARRGYEIAEATRRAQIAIGTFTSVGPTVVRTLSMDPQKGDALLRSVGTVPTVDIANGMLPREMPQQLLMPGPGILGPDLEHRYQHMPAIVLRHLNLMGSGGAEPVEQRSDPYRLRGQQEAGITDYISLVSDELDAFKTLRNGDAQVAISAEQSSAVATKAKTDIADVVRFLNTHAALPPPPETSHDDWTARHLCRALDMLHCATRAATERIGELTATVDEVGASLVRSASSAV